MTMTAATAQDDGAPLSEGKLLAGYFSRLSAIDPMKLVGSISRAVGLIIESKGPPVAVGDICVLEGREEEANTLLEVIGFRDSTILSMPLGRMPNVRMGDRIVAPAAAA